MAWGNDRLRISYLIYEMRQSDVRGFARTSRDRLWGTDCRSLHVVPAFSNQAMKRRDDQDVGPAQAVVTVDDRRHSQLATERWRKAGLRSADSLKSRCLSSLPKTTLVLLLP